MSGSIENLVLEHLKRFQAGQDRIERKLAEHTTRLGNIEIALAHVNRGIAQQEERAAEQSVRVDRLTERLERIERRLDLDMA
ncbi:MULTISPECIES: hypothetical protein [Asaia]|uniref:Uncharacterized protein n=1 Tax=Asaia spathodeae TaxID=657016 RepID=A0ABX2P8F0_9PROT|nr:hypothetical protein [Asaia spathodeae]GBR16154.1 hypothetical protein AA105894_1508 [Asaia spathodeae NBRC 105894]